ncbi:MAG: M1 family peptidase [Bacteroidia bacterium]|nr:M1 family peptidase [Bacteroidia bacterium]
MKHTQKVLFYLIFLLNIPFAGHVQSSKVFPPNNYRTPENEFYWKNRPPHPDYWQQDVHYTIFANVITAENRIEGNETLEYWNNSPDTLHEIYFHLYQQAFQPGSYRDRLVRVNKRVPRYGNLEKEGKGTEIIQVQEDGRDLVFGLDNTIMKVKLPDPLLPGQRKELNIRFNTWFDHGPERRRMDVNAVEIRKADGSVYEEKQFKGVLWYPRVAVYDRKVSWHLDQHLGKEFYGEIGTYDVALTFPSHYIVEGTGQMLNRSNVLPEDLLLKLYMGNFKGKPLGETASEVLPVDGKSKTWHFHAENVHDFGFIADPTFRLDRVLKNGVECVAVAQESHAGGWQDAAAYTAKIIDAYSGYIGVFAWPKIIVADAYDGMEYPMMTLDGGSSPEYHDLFAHEVGHMWFFGMLGSNETYRAYLDEGFTQYLTAWFMTREDRLSQVNYASKSEEQYFSSALYGYLRDAREGYDGTLNTHSHDFHNAVGHENGYGQVYYKSASMLYNLQYVLGPQIFQGAMHHYFEKWKMAHPYPEDFREAISEYAKTDLSWFFDQWLETDKQIDYAVGEVQTKAGGTEVQIEFERKGEMIMPLDFTVVTWSGDSLHYTISVSAWQKPDPARTFLPKWEGSGKLNPTYKVDLSLPDKFAKVIIDPSRILADVNLLDNQSGFIPVKTKFSLLPRHQDWPAEWEKYYLNLRPSVWWNGFSGVQAGAVAEGNYFNQAGKTYLGMWISTGLAETNSLNPQVSDPSGRQIFNYEYRYETPLRKISRNLDLLAHSLYRDGVQRHGLGFTKTWARARKYDPEYHRIGGSYTLLRREDNASLDYLNFPDQWTPGLNNAFAQAFYEKGFASRYGTGFARFGLRTAAPGSDSQYSWADFDFEMREQFGKLVFKYRAYLRYGEGNVPRESALYMEGGSPEEMVGDNYYRARGFFPNTLLNNNLGQQTYHYHFGGGLNLRGYAGYRAEFPDAGAAWYGSSGGCINVEMEFDRFIPLRIPELASFLKVRTYLFLDAGTVGRSIPGVGFDRVEWSAFRMDAGPGVALHFQNPKAAHQKPLVLRADFPVWVNRAPAFEQFLQFRWVLGIGRAF